MKKPRPIKAIGRKRRAAGWTLLALGLLVAAVWAWSGNYRYLRERGEWAVTIHEGRIELTYRGSYQRTCDAVERLGNTRRWRARSGEELAMVQADCFQADLGFLSYSEAPLRHPASGRFVSAGFRLWSLVLWPLPLLLCTPAAFLLRSGYLARRRATTNGCAKCGYSLAGLASGAPCPECGRGAATAPHPAGIYTAGPNGLIITSVSAIASPLGFIGVLFMGYSSLAIVGSFLMLGMFLCVVGCFRRPRASAVAGLIVGTLCLTFWTVVCLWITAHTPAQP